ncbi:MAG: hypothetical protein ABI137_07015 [Antricoccus sp.]
MRHSFATYLRVYEPLSAFKPRERRRLADLLSAAADQSAAQLHEQELLALLPALRGASIDLSVLNSPQLVHTISVRGKVLVCPFDTKLRALQAVIDSEWAVPFPLNEWSMDRAARRQAAALLSSPFNSRRGGLAHVRSMPWRAPVWWCALFTDADRLTTGDGRDVRYRIGLALAISRCSALIEAMTDSFGDLEFAADLQQVGQWLQRFDETAVLELDLGGVIRPGYEELGSVHEAVGLAARSAEQLIAGRTEESFAAYGEFVDLWERLALLQGHN